MMDRERGEGTLRKQFEEMHEDLRPVLTFKRAAQIDRDPRIDPRPGDVLRVQHGGMPRYAGVMHRDGDDVTWGYAQADAPSPLSGWRLWAKNSEIVHLAPANTEDRS